MILIKMRLTVLNTLIVLVLLSLVFFVYWHVKSFDFVNFDDPIYVLENPMVQKGFTLEGLCWAFTDATYKTNYWAPLTWITFLIDYQLYGLKAYGYHLTNLIIHALNVCILYFLMVRITRSKLAAFIVATLLGIHPIHVESVAWVTERKDVLSGFFWILSLKYYLDYLEKKDLRSYLILFASVFFGFMAKPIMVTIPFVFLLLDFWPAKRLSTMDNKVFIDNRSFLYIVFEKAPFFLMSFFFSWLSFFAQRNASAIASLSNISIHVRIMNAAISYCEYISKLFLPVKLAAIYPYSRQPSILMAVMSFAILFLISLLVLKKIGKYPFLAVGWFWFIGVIFPVNGLVVIGPHAMADRYMYIPAIGLYLIMGVSIKRLYEEFKNLNVYLTVFLLSALVMLMLQARRQTFFWRNSVALFEHAINVTENNMLAYYNLGMEMSYIGKSNEAIKYYIKAIEINPGESSFHTNLGVEYKMIGDYDKAVKHFELALKLNPEQVEALVNIASIEFERGDQDASIKYLKNAILAKPEYYLSYNLLGNIMMVNGQYKEALGLYMNALNRNPTNAGIFNNIGAVFVKLGKLKEAKLLFAEALVIDPSNSLYRKNLESVQKATE